MIGENDTSRSPEAAHAGATRQTYMIGNAVALACRQAKNKLFAQIAKEWNVDIQTLKAHDGEIWSEGTNYRIPMSEAIKVCKKKYGVVPVGGENYTSHHTGLHPEDGSGKPWQAYVFGGQVAEVEVDTATGEVQLLGIWACHDVGRAINPKGVEGQVEGGVVQAVGQALMENFELDNGKTSSGNLAKYILPTSLDVPKVKTKIVEDPDPLSPLGAKGIGEPAMVPTAPAIMNAIYDAVGVRIKSLPATPEKILSALREKQRKSLNKSLN